MSFCFDYVRKHASSILNRIKVEEKQAAFIRISTNIKVSSYSLHLNPLTLCNEVSAYFSGHNLTYLTYLL